MIVRAVAVVLAGVLLLAVLLAEDIRPADEPTRVPVPACAEAGECVYDHDARVYVRVGCAP